MHPGDCVQLMFASQPAPYSAAFPVSGTAKASPAISARNGVKQCMVGFSARMSLRLRTDLEHFLHQLGIFAGDHDFRDGVSVLPDVFLQRSNIRFRLGQPGFDR